MSEPRIPRPDREAVIREPDRARPDPARPLPMAHLTCPVCHNTEEPAMRIGAVAICGFCSSTLFVDPDTSVVTKATATAIEALSAGELAQLRRVRGQKVRTERRR